MSDAPTPGSQRIEVRGLHGESLVLDDGVISKWRHDGKQQVSRNLARTYRQCDVTPRTEGLFKKRETGELVVSLVCGSIFSLTIEEAQRPELDRLVAALEAQREG